MSCILFWMCFSGWRCQSVMSPHWLHTHTHFSLTFRGSAKLHRGQRWKTVVSLFVMTFFKRFFFYNHDFLNLKICTAPVTAAFDSLWTQSVQSCYESCWTFASQIKRSSSESASAAWAPDLPTREGLCSINTYFIIISVWENFSIPCQR